MRPIRRQLVIVLLSAALLFVMSFLSLHQLSLTTDNKTKLAFLDQNVLTVYFTRASSPHNVLDAVGTSLRFQNKTETWVDNKHTFQKKNGQHRPVSCCNSFRDDVSAVNNGSLLVSKTYTGAGYTGQKDYNPKQRTLINNNNNNNNSNTNSNITGKHLEDVHIYPLRDPNSVILEADHNKSVENRIELNNDMDSGFDYDYRRSIYEKYYVPIKASNGIDCTKLAAGDVHTITIGRARSKSFLRTSIPASSYAAITNCGDFKLSRGYINHPLSPVERDFPLAFGIMAYRDIEQVERLLRAIYRPHNSYCIHLDANANDEDRAALAAIASCFDNVILVPDAVAVRWGKFSVLEIELICLRHLWNYQNWKYYINLTGQEFPLKTNLELVRVLMAMKGANLVDGTSARSDIEELLKDGSGPPHNIRPVKGSIHVALNRDFVDFCLHDNRSRDFLEWLKKTSIPDETFFASLNHNPHLGIPGTFLGKPEAYALKPFFVRYKVWSTGPRERCSGKFVRWICILGAGDIHKALNSVALFANKFHLNYQYAGYECLEEILYQKTWDQYLTNAIIDVTFYSLLDQVRLQQFRTSSTAT